MRLVEQVVAPRDRTRESLLAARQVSRARAKHLQARLQPAQQSLRREELDPRGGQLDGERQSVDTLADAGHGRRIFIRDSEVGLDGDSPLDEQLHRLVLRQRRRRRLGSRIWQPQRLNRELLLAIHVKHGAAADHRFQP